MRPRGDRDPDWRGDGQHGARCSEKHHQGAFCREGRGTAPQHVLPKPPELSFEQAACLTTAWLTAYRMLFTRGNVVPGATVLIQSHLKRRCGDHALTVLRQRGTHAVRPVCRGAQRAGWGPIRCFSRARDCRSVSTR